MARSVTRGGAAPGGHGVTLGAHTPAGELERAQVLLVSLQLELADLRDRLDEHERRHAWLPVLLALLFVLLVVFVFRPIGG